jgi:hypothetical protein
MASQRSHGRSCKIEEITHGVFGRFRFCEWTVADLHEHGITVPPGTLNFMRGEGIIRRNGRKKVGKGYYSTWALTAKGQKIAARRW